MNRNVQAPRAGAQLRAHRHRAGLSVDALARQSGITPRTIYLLEGGYVLHPKERTLRAIARACGVPYAALRDAYAASSPDPADAA